MQMNNIDVVETVFDSSCTVKSENSKSVIDVEINKQSVRFHMDSMAPISIINLKTYGLLQRPKLVKSNSFA